MAERDLYKVLGVGRKASAKEIKKAYRKMAAKFHPDKNNGDKASEKRFKEISAAYQVLGNEEKRQQYDEYGSNWESYAQNGGPGSGEARYYGRGTEGSGRSDGWQHFQKGGSADGQGQWDDILNNIFAGGFKQSRSKAGAAESPFDGMHYGSQQGFYNTPRRGADMEANLEISLEEAFEGTRTQIFLDGQTINVSIPAGAYSGQKLRLSGKGGPGNSGGPSGDLYLNIRVKEHSIFRLEGLDLHLDLPVTPTEAVMGAQIKVPTLKGSINVRIPAASNSGKVLRLKNMGMKDTKGGQGNLLAHLKIVLPESLSQKEKELYSELGKLNSQDVREKLNTVTNRKKNDESRAA